MGVLLPLLHAYAMCLIIIVISLLIQKRILQILKSRHSGIWKQYGRPEWRDLKKRKKLWRLMNDVCFHPSRFPKDKVLRQYMLAYRLLFIPTLLIPIAFFMRV